MSQIINKSVFKKLLIEIFCILMIGSLSACGIHSKDVTNTQQQVSNTMKTEDIKELPIYEYEVKEIRCDNSGQSIFVSVKLFPPSTDLPRMG